MQISIAQIVPVTQAEGPGRRFALWFQGCPLRCVECCNPEMLPFDGRVATDVDDLVRQIDAAYQTHQIEGITMMGGEPFAHAAAAGPLAAQVRRLGLSVMIFTGYELSELHAMGDSHVNHLLSNTDLLIDGPYDRSQPDTTRRWIGSGNQQIHFLTDRYRPQDSYWSEADTLEIRLNNGELTVNGFPAKAARTVWKRIPRT